MNAFQAKRVVKEFSQTVPAPAHEVFPLLCPVREYEWIDGWTSEIVYSESGVAENNCIFKTNATERGEELWVVSRYDPDNLTIEFTTFNQIGMVFKLDIAIEQDNDTGTTVRFSHALTGLTEAGNKYVQEYADKRYAAVMGFLGQSLDHFCRTGRMLRRPS